MNCPSCRTENPDQANFCSNCGQRLLLVCPNCATENRPSANFCNNCGERLSAEAAAPSEAQQELAKYIPKELLIKLEAARRGRAMAGERRVVTILFCDVKGSTAAAERIDPEDWAEIMNGAFERLIAPVYRYEGTLARLMGDAVLAFFGAPIAHEDDPERAVLAGLEIVAGIGPYRELVSERWGIDFNVRVGINTGLVVVGEVGSDLRVEYTAMGDAVNLAARMEQTAEPGTVQIAEETYRRVAPLFELQALGKVEVKGKLEPVAAYRVERRKAQPGRLRGIQGLEAPLIGRQREMRALAARLQELTRGRGSVLCLIGEAGLGKSRIVQELKRDFAGSNDQFYWGESRGISYETTRPYGQFRQHIQLLYGIAESEQPAEIRRKLGAGLAGLGLGDGSARALQALLAVEELSNGNGLEGEALKRELYKTNLAIWRRQAEQRPTVLVFDDLHWADSASTELLRELFRLTDSAPLLFLCAFRPDRSAPSWKLKQFAEAEYPHRYTELALEPLSAGNSQTLVDQLLTVAELPPKLHALIQQKSEGNPLFVEEVVRTLIDSGAVVRDERSGRWQATTEIEEIQIPDNLQSLLVSRIDRLQAEVRRTLQLASVIGRSFYYRVLQAISEAVQDLDDHLSDLLRTELILEAARNPEPEYAFRHALTREAAYRSILRRERSDYHLKVAEALERLYPERTAELAPLLAHHFLEAGSDRSVAYSIVAGDEAFRLYAIREAIGHYRNALETTDPVYLKHVFTRLGRSHELVTEYAEALELYRSMAAAGRERSDSEMELIALTESAKLYSTPNPVYDSERGRGLSDQALELARELGNHEAEARILWNRMNAETFAGEVEAAAEYGELSLKIAEEFSLREQLAFSLNDLSRPLMMLGEVDRGHEGLRRARQIWSELNNLPMLADSTMSAAMLHGWSGQFEESLSEAQEARRIAQSIENSWGELSAEVWIGNAQYYTGRFQQAIHTLEHCLQLAEQVGAALPILYSSAQLALIFGELGSPERGLEALAAADAVDPEAFAHFRPKVHAARARVHLWAGDLSAAKRAAAAARENLKPVGGVGVVDDVLLAQAEIALFQGQTEQTIARIDELLELAAAVNRRLQVPEALLLKASALRQDGMLEPSRQALDQAKGEVQETGAQRLHWRILLALSDLQAEQGDQQEAARLRREAGKLVSELIGTLSDRELQRSFLALPQIQEALEA